MKLATLLIALSLLAGCSKDGQPLITHPFPKDAKDKVSAVEKDTEAAKNKLAKASAGIDRSAEGIISSTKEPESKKAAEDILDENKNVKDVANVDLPSILKQLAEHKQTIIEFGKNSAEKDKKIATLEKSLTAAQEKNKQLELESRKWINFALGTIIVGSVLCFGGAVFLFLQGATGLGVSLGGAAVTVAGLSIAIVGAWQQILWVGFGLIVLIFLGIGWAVLRQLKKTAAERDTMKSAFKETVATVETMKPSLPQEVKDSLFGVNAKSGLADKLQSDTTKELVKQERTSGVD